LETLCRNGYDIIKVKEWYPIEAADFFSFGITAGKTTYVEYWSKSGYVSYLKSHGSSKATGSPDKTHYA